MIHQRNVVTPWPGMVGPQISISKSSELVDMLPFMAKGFYWYASVKDFEMERFSWVIWGAPRWQQGFYKRKMETGRVRIKGDVTMEAEADSKRPAFKLCKWPLEARKSKKRDFPPQLTERTQICQPF